jgi:hypothetical protein
LLGTATWSIHWLGAACCCRRIAISPESWRLGQPNEHNQRPSFFPVENNNWAPLQLRHPTTLTTPLVAPRTPLRSLSDASLTVASSPLLFNRNHGKGFLGYVAFPHYARVPTNSCTTVLTHNTDDEESSGSAPGSPQIVARRGKFDDEEEDDVSATSKRLAAQHSLTPRTGP